MVQYDPISALEKREAEKEQNRKTLKVSIIFGVISFIVTLVAALVCGKRLGLY